MKHATQYYINLLDRRARTSEDPLYGEVSTHLRDLQDKVDALEWELEELKDAYFLNL